MCAAFMVAVVVVGRPREDLDERDALNQGGPAMQLRIRRVSSSHLRKPKPRNPLKLSQSRRNSTAGWTTMMLWRLIVKHAGMARDVLGRAGVMGFSGHGRQDWRAGNTGLAGLMSRGSGAGQGSDKVRCLGCRRSERC